MEDVAFGQAEELFQVQRGAGFHARAAMRVNGEQVGDILFDEGADLAQVGLQDLLARGGVILQEPAVRHVQAEEGQGLVALLLQTGREDRGVCQAVAVHLTGQPAQADTGASILVGFAHLLVAFIDMERAVEGILGRDARVFHGGQLLQHHVDLEDRAFHLLLFVHAGQNAVGDVGSGVEQHKARLHGLLGAFHPVDHRVARLARLHAEHLRPGAHLHAQPSGPVDQRIHQRAHAAHRHAPLARPLPDHVIEEGAVLQQAGVFRVGGHADLRVGEDRSANGVVGEVIFDQAVERLFHQIVPDLALGGGLKAGAQVFFRRQRREQRGPDLAGKEVQLFVQRQPALVLALAARAAAGEVEERLAGNRF